MKLAVLLITTLIVLFGGIAAQHQLSDDACISLRYARNIAEGYGSVSQIGSQPVEGYSNWLMVHLTALIGFLFSLNSWEGYIVIVSCINLFSYVITSVLIYIWSRKSGLVKRFALFNACLVATSWVIHSYRCHGLETCQHMLVITLLGYSLYFGSPLLIMLSGLLVSISRPEGMFLAIPLIVCWIVEPAFIKAVREHTGKKLSQAQKPMEKTIDIVKRRIGFSLIFWFGLMAFLGWRFSMFGDFVPNTVRAKVFSTDRGIHEGISYLLVGLRSWPVFTLGLLSSVLWMFRKNAKNFPGRFRLMLLVVLQLLFIIKAGGDDSWFGQWRFFVPIAPIVLLNIGVAFDFLDKSLSSYNQKRLPGWLVPKKMSSVSLVLVLIICIFMPTYSYWSVGYEFDWVNDMMTGIHWNRILKPDPWHEYFFGIELAKLVHDDPNIAIVNGQAGGFMMPFRSVLHRDPCGLIDRDAAVVSPEKRVSMIAATKPEIWIGFEERVLSPSGWHFSGKFYAPENYTLQAITEIVWNYNWYGQEYVVQTLLFPIYTHSEFSNDFSEFASGTTFKHNVKRSDGTCFQVPYFRIYSDLN